MPTKGDAKDKGKDEYAKRPNQAAKVSAQAVLMENYTSPSVPVEGLSRVVTTYRGSNLHGFGTTTKGGVVHYQVDPTSFTGWRGDDVSLGSGVKPVMLCACTQSSDGNIALFALDSTSTVWMRKAEPVRDGQMQAFVSDWGSLGRYSKSSIVSQGISLGTDRQLYGVFEDKSGKAPVYRIPWGATSSSKWDQLSNSYDHGYALAGGKKGTYVSAPRGGAYYVRFLNSSSGSADIYRSSNFWCTKLLPSTLTSTDPTYKVYGLGSDKRLRYFTRDSKGTERGTEVLGLDVKDFAVVGVPYSDEEEEQLYASQELVHVVATNGNTYVVTYDEAEGTFSKELQTGTKAAVIDGSTWRTESATHASAMYVAAGAGELLEVEHNGASSVARTHVRVEKPVPTTKVAKSNELAVGTHEGETNVVSINSSDKQVYKYARFVRSGATATDIWEAQALKLPKNTAVQVTVASDKLSRMSIFVEDSKRGVWGLVVGLNDDWVPLGTFPDKDNRILRAGVIDGKVVLLAGTDDGVFQVPTRSRKDWSRRTSSYKTLYDISFGSDSAEEGFFVSEHDSDDSDRAVRFHVLSTKSSRKTFGKQQSLQYTQCCGTAARTDDVFAVDKNGSVRYLNGEKGEGKRVLADNNKTRGISVYTDGDGHPVVLATGTDNIVRRVTMTAPGKFTSAKEVAATVVDCVGVSATEGYFARDSSRYPKQLKQQKLKSGYTGQNMVYAVGETWTSATVGRARYMEMGLHKGETQVVVVNGNDNRLYRCERDSQPRLEGDIWKQTSHSSKHAIQSLTLATRPDDQALMMFVQDTNRNVLMWTVGVDTEWVLLGQYPSKNCDYRLLKAGVINSKVVLLTSYRGKDADHTGVFQIPVDEGSQSQSTSNWARRTSKGSYYEIQDISFGADSVEQGFFIAEQDHGDKDKAVRFHHLSSQGIQKTFGKQQKKQYQQCCGTPDMKDSVFAVDEDGSVRYLAKSSDEGTSVFPGYKARGINVYLNREREPVVVATCTDNTVRRVTMADPGKFPPSELVAASVYETVSMNSEESYFGRAASSYLPTQLHQVPMKEGYGGARMTYATAQDTENTEFKSWQVTLMTCDHNGIGVGFEKVHFSPVEEDVSVEVNGKSVQLNVDDPAMTVLTNARGVAVFTLIADSLNAPLLSVTTDYHPEDGVSVIEPNKEEQMYLGSVSEEELKSAVKVGSKGPLFEDPSVVDEDFVAALHETCAVAEQSEDITNAYDLSKVHHTVGRSSILHSTTRARVKEIARLDPEVCKKVCFHIHYARDKVTGRRTVQFKRGGRDPKKIKKELKAAAKEHDAQEYTGSYADIMQSANAGHADVLDAALLPPSEENVKKLGFRHFVEAVVIFAVPGAATGVMLYYVFKGLIVNKGDVMATVQSLFSHVKVMFHQVYDWLAAFFNWGDVLQTQQMFEQSVLKMGSGINAYLNHIVDDGYSVDAWNTAMGKVDDTPKYTEKTGDDGMDDSNEATQETGDPGRASRGNPDSSDETNTNFGDDPQGNWLMDHFLDLMPNFEFDFMEGIFTSAMTKAVSSMGTTITTTMLPVIKELVTELLAEILGLFTEKGSGCSLGEFLKRIQRALLGAVETAVTTTTDQILRSMGVLVEGIIEGLNTPIEIPFFTKLWKSVITRGKDLTVLNLMTLLMALPATLGYKAAVLCVTGGKKMYAPFVATNSDVQDPRYQVSNEFLATVNIFDAEEMRRATKMGGGGKLRLTSTEDDITWKDIVTFTFGLTYGLSYIGMGAFDCLSFITEKANLANVSELSVNYGFGKRYTSRKDWKQIFSIILNFTCQVYSCPLWGRYEELPRQVLGLEMTIWCWNFILFGFDVTSFSGTIEAKRKNWRSKPLMLIGGIQTCLMISLTAVEGVELDTSNPYDTASFSLKIFQNYPTNLGYTLDILRAKSKTPYQVLAFNGGFYFLPGCIAMVRGGVYWDGIQDKNIGDDDVRLPHQVAY